MIRNKKRIRGKEHVVEAGGQEQVLKMIPTLEERRVLSGKIGLPPFACQKNFSHEKT